MPVIREMKVDHEAWSKNDPKGKVRFDFVAIARDKSDKWDESTALKLVAIDTFSLDWDGGLRCSGFWEDTRGAMEQQHSETFPYADPMDDAPLPVMVPSEMKSHAKAMQGKNSEIMSEPHPINIHPRHFYWKPEAREGYFNYNPVTRKVGPFGEGHYRALMQAFDNQANNPDIGTDKPGGHLQIKKFRANHEKLKTYVGRPVKWELRIAEAGM